MVYMLLSLLFCCLHAATCQDYIPCLSKVGAGYEVLNGKFAESDSVKMQLFDLDQDSSRVETVRGTRYLVPNTVDIQTNIETEEYQVFGKSLEQYHSSLSSKVGIDTSYLMFSASTSEEFSQASFTRVSNAYTREQYNVGLYKLSLQGDIPTLKQMLMAQHRDAIDNWDSTTLFQSYGTHFLTGILVGGRLVYSMVTDRRAYRGSTSISTIAHMRYSNAVFGTSVDGNVQYADLKTFRSATQVMAKTVGGNPEYGHSKAVENVALWSDSVQSYPEFVDFADSHSLMPIWELASTQARRDYLEKQYQSYCEKYQKTYVLAGPPYLYAREMTAYVFADDAGQKSDRDMTVTMPLTDTLGGWYAVSQRPFNFIGTPPTHKLLNVKAIPGVDSKMKVVQNSDFLRIWRCGNWAYFRAKALSPYHTLTDIMVDPETNWQSTGKIVNDLAAIHLDCLEAASVGKFVWNSYGEECNAPSQASTYEVEVYSDGINLGFVTNNASFSVAPSVQPWRIKKSCLLFD